MNAAFLLFDDLEELDLVGPWEMMTVWHEYLGGPACDMVAKTTGEISCAKTMRLLPHLTLEQLPNPDYLFIPGGIGTRKAMQDPILLDYVRQQAATGTATLSICTGSFILQAADLLAGKRATTHWSQLETLAELGVDVVKQRHLQQDNIWTSAGVSAGIDMTLTFIAHTAGQEIANKVRHYTEYYPEAPGTKQT